MTKNILGEQISKFRKEAGLTQEELGKAVGVSTQAVSRWECGGMPDIELLPAIADRLHVSIDALFGREGGEAFDLKKLLYCAIQNAPGESGNGLRKSSCVSGESGNLSEKSGCVPGEGGNAPRKGGNAPGKRGMEELLEYVWIMQCAYIANQSPEYSYVSDMLSSITVADRSMEKVPEQTPAQIAIHDDRGCMLQGLAKDIRFSLILSESDDGYAAMLKKPGEYVRLFQLLAKPHYLEMLIDIDMRPQGEYFTASLAASRIGIPEEAAQEILDELTLRRMILKLNVADAAGTICVYQKDSQINLPVFLFFCGQLMRCADSVDMCINLRKKPNFTDLPGTGSLVADWKT